MADAGQETVNRWLKIKENNFPHLLQGSKGTRFREVVNKYQSFRALLQRENQPVSVEDLDSKHDADSHDDDDNSTLDEPEVAPDVDNLSDFLHEITRIGCCAALTDLLGNEIEVDEPAEVGTTALHIAAEYGKYEDMKILLEAGAVIKADHQDLTPLHVAALSDEPNPQIAKLLIECMLQQNTEGYKWINFQESTRDNTVLHFAAENEQISRDFIQVLESVDPSTKNNKFETAFHVAAKAENPEVILWMLEVFSPAVKGWTVRDIETERKPTLLEICARRGNAKAVALLIKCGADIYDKILFDLIDESVNHPEMTEKLIGVYRTITENCVLFERLKAASNERFRYPRRATQPDEYGRTQRKAMLKLMSCKNDEGRLVLKHAVHVGADVFLRTIVNTPNVFKIPVPEEGNVVKYDITAFIKIRERAERECGHAGSSRRSARVSPDNESPPSEEAAVTSYTPLLGLISERNLWRNTDILQVEPFLAITQPICALAQLVFLVLALIQFAFMIFMSVTYIPYECVSIYINCTFLYFSENERILTKVSTLVGVWIFALCTFVLGIDALQSCLNACCTCGAILRVLLSPMAMYIVVMVLWIVSIGDRPLFISITSLVHLFGWLVTMSLFFHASQKINIFLFLVKEIIVEDILFSFGIVFVFILVGFSSAVHVLRLAALSGNNTYADTVYNLFASALTTGDFIKYTLEDSNRDAHQYLLVQLRVTFAIFLCSSTIILLNILISMMNNRYADARKKAKNLWRFNAVTAGLLFMKLFCCSDRKLCGSLNKFSKLSNFFYGRSIRRIR